MPPFDFPPSPAFPSNPTEGQIFTPPGGPTYVFRSPVWRAVTPGQILTALPRNRFTNGAMQISQQNADAAGTGSAYYMADQWSSSFSGAGAMSFVRAASPTPKGSRYRLRATVTTATASPGLCAFSQSIEGSMVADYGFGGPAARQLVCRFGFRGPAGTYHAKINLLPSGARSYVTPFTISAAQANTDTEQIVIFPGDVTGAWLTDASGAIGFAVTIAAQASLTAPAANAWQAGNYVAGPGQINGMAIVGNTFELFDVGLYLDPDNTGQPPKWEMPDAAQELAACQRYFYATPSTIATFFSGNVTSGGNYYGACEFPVMMRTSPSCFGINGNQVNFPATVGTLNASPMSVFETRLANATGVGLYHSGFHANARL